MQNKIQACLRVELYLALNILQDIKVEKGIFKAHILLLNRKYKLPKLLLNPSAPKQANITHPHSLSCVPDLMRGTTNNIVRF